MSGKYAAGRQRFGEARCDWPKDNIVAQLVSAEYIFNPLHKTGADLTGAVGKPVALTGKSIENGWAKCNNLVFAQVTGPDVVAIVLRCEGRAEATLIAYLDGIDNFPMKPNGGDILVAVPADGLFRL